MTQSHSSGRTLAQTLAVQTQLNLPGTAGRLLKQIRDLERVAPLFVRAGLVRPVSRPNPLELRVGGIATQSTLVKALGGFLYAAAAVRVDLVVAQNAISNGGQDSVCEIDDINYEEQSKRLQLIGIRQAYELADAAMRSSERYDLLLLDCPLVLNRSMVPLRDSGSYAGHRAAYDQAIAAITRFWSTHHDHLCPFNPEGTAVLGLASERFGAIVQLAQQDLRSPEGQRNILATEGVALEHLHSLEGAASAIAGIGERRFIHGILSSFTRTAAFHMDAQTPRMEPTEVAKLGVVGFHFKAAHTASPRLLQLIGGSPDWERARLDQVCGQIMALTLVGGPRAAPLPIQLAERELKALEPFLQYYRQGVQEELKRREVEDLWLSDLDDLK